MCLTGRCVGNKPLCSARVHNIQSVCLCQAQVRCALVRWPIFALTERFIRECNSDFITVLFRTS